MLYTNYFTDILQRFDQNKPVLFDEKKTMLAGDLYQSSLQLAGALQAKGVKKGDRVVLALMPGIEFLQVMYANMFLRTMVSIIDPQMGRENYLAKLTQFNPQHAFVDSRLIFLSEHPLLKYLVLKLKGSIPSFPKLKHTSIYTSGISLPIFQRHTPVKKLIGGSNKLCDVIDGDENEEFLVTYTSGTLAQPKGVVHSFKSLSNSIKYLSELLIENEDTSMATHLPHFALLGISAGVNVNMWKEHLSPEEKLSFIHEKKITTLFGPPSDYLPLIQYIENNKVKIPTSLKNMYMGSAPVFCSFLSKVKKVCENITIICLYGMTENLMVAHVRGDQKLSTDEEGDLVGNLFPNVHVTIASDGEILLSSDQLYSRYLEMEKHRGTHATGDLGIIDCSGQLILLGRKKDMIIRRNFNVYPGLYEPTINKIDGITEAVMIGIYREEKADEEIVLVIEGEKNLSVPYIERLLRTGKFSIDKEALPDKIIFRELPRSGRQYKVNRKLLSEQIKAIIR